MSCLDGICAVVSTIGIAADGLQTCTSFIPGPNITAVVTMPISVSFTVSVFQNSKEIINTVFNPPIEDF